MSKFQVGDKVRYKASGYVGTILSGNDADGYSVHYPCDDEEYFVRKDEIDFVDAKGVFLQRLQALLREFDAEIDVYAGDDGDCCIGFKFRNQTEKLTIVKKKELILE